MGNFIKFIQGVKDKLFGAKPQQPEQKPLFPEPSSKENLTEKGQPTADCTPKSHQPPKIDVQQTSPIQPHLPPILGPEDQVPFHTKPQPPKSPPPTPLMHEQVVPQKPQPSNVPEFKKRDPYFFQIGFDFGTSFSKCIIRDVMINSRLGSTFPLNLMEKSSPF